MRQVATSPDGNSIAYDVDGAGEPALVFVHGWSCDRSYWAAQMASFRKRHRVVTVDLAGHGESGTDRADWTMAAFGADVVAVVDQLGLDRVVLVGHSMGGDVIVESALTLGDKVAAVVWVDTYTTLENPDTREEVLAFIEPFRRDFGGQVDALMRRYSAPSTDPALLDWIIADMSAAPQAIALNAMEHSIGNQGPIRDQLLRLEAPAFAINPSDGTTDVDSLARHGVRYVEITDVGHFVMMEDPAQFDRLLGQIVAGL